jgi:hypothetical protein
MILRTYTYRVTGLNGEPMKGEIHVRAREEKSFTFHALVARIPCKFNDRKLVRFNLRDDWQV